MIVIRLVAGFLVFAVAAFGSASNPIAEDERATVAGFVLDYETLEPIKWANVVVSGTSYGDPVLCDNGSFIIRDVPPGEQTIVAMMMDYGVGKATIELESGEVKLLVFKLKRSN